VVETVYDIIRSPEDEPLVLAGPPRALTGRVDLHNPGDVNLVLRNAGLRDPGGVLIGQPLRHALPLLVLRPHQERNVSLKVAVDPATPPGEYSVELELAGRTRPVVLHVAEVFDLSIRPASLVVANAPGQAQRKQLIVTNEGNVPITVGEIGEVDLKDDMVWDRAVRIAIEPWAGKADVEIEEFVVAVLRVAREEAYQVGSLVVRNLNGRVDVSPGETKVIDLEITLREELPLNSRYRGRAPLLTQDLEIVVVSSNEPLADEPPPVPALRAGKKTRRSTTPRKTTK
jgi:hypothetical protein